MYFFKLYHITPLILLSETRNTLTYINDTFIIDLVHRKDVDLLRSILEEHGIQLNIQKGTLGDVQCTLSGHEAKLTEHDTALADIQVDDRLEELSVIADQLMNATTQASAGI